MANPSANGSLYQPGNHPHAGIRGPDPRPSTILGPDGRPLPSSEDRWTRQVQEYGEAPIPHVVTFSSLLGRAWRTYRINRADEAMKHGREEALAMKRDAYLQGLLQERKLAVANRPWRIEVDNPRDPWQKLVKDGITRVVKDTHRLNKLRYYIHEGIWYGRYGSQLVFEWANLPMPMMGNPNPTAQKVLRIKQHLPINGDKIDFRWDGTPVMLVHGSEGPVSPNVKTVLTDKGRAAVLEGNLRKRFIIHSHESVDADFFDADSASAVWGLGIRSVLFWLNWLRQEWLANIADWCERTGLGLRLWYYQGGNTKSKEAVQEAARNQSDKTNILIPRFATGGGQAYEGVDYVDTASAGADLLLRLQQHVEEHIERYVIGQTLSSSTEGSGLGGTGVADAHMDTKTNITKFDAGNESDTFSSDLIPTLVHYTYPWADFPVRYVVDVDDYNKKERMDAVRMAFVEMGIDFREDDVRGLTGLDAPQDGDRTLKQLQQEAQAAGMPLQHGSPFEKEDEDGEDFTQPMHQSRVEHSLGRYAYDPNEARDDTGKWTSTSGGGEKPEKQGFLKKLAVKTKDLMDYGPAIAQHYRGNMRAIVAQAAKRDGTQPEYVFSSQVNDQMAKAQSWTNKALGTFFNKLKAKAGAEKVSSPEWKKLHDHFREVYAGLREHIDGAAEEALQGIREGEDVRDAIDTYMDEYKQDVKAAVYSIMDVFDEVMGRPKWEGERPKTARQERREKIDKALEAHRKRKAEEPKELFSRQGEVGRYGTWEESKHPRDEQGKFTESLHSVPVGEMRRVGGWMVRRVKDDKWRIDTDEKHIVGGHERIGKHIRKAEKLARLEGKKYGEAVARGKKAGDAPDILSDAKGAADYAEKFHALPSGAKVVSLDPETFGRLGSVVKANGKNRVKLDGEPGYVSEWVEPLEGWGEKVSQNANISEGEEKKGKRSRYQQVVDDNLKQMDAPAHEWSALSTKGMEETVNEHGDTQSMPVFDFPSGYDEAPSVFKGMKNTCCLCGHDIKNYFWIKNDSKKWVMPVGSECVSNFAEGKSGIKLAKEDIAKANRDVVRQLEDTKRALHAQFTKEEPRYELIGGKRTEMGTTRTWLLNNPKADEAKRMHQQIKELLGDVTAKVGAWSQKLQKHDPNEPVWTDRQIANWHKANGEAASELLKSSDSILAPKKEAKKEAPPEDKLTIHDLRDDEPSPKLMKALAEAVAEELQGSLFGDDKPRQKTLFARAEPARYSKDSEGHWIIIGAQEGEDGKKHGGSPVYIENGTITKGHPKLHGRKIEALKEEEGPKERGEKKEPHEMTKAEWEKKNTFHPAIWGDLRKNAEYISRTRPDVLITTMPTPGKEGHIRVGRWDNRGPLGHTDIPEEDLDRHLKENAYQRGHKIVTVEGGIGGTFPSENYAGAGFRVDSKGVKGVRSFVGPEDSLDWMTNRLASGGYKTSVADVPEELPEKPGVKAFVGETMLPDHSVLIERALAEGKPVPPEVLADYPDLAAQYPQTTPRYRLGDRPPEPELTGSKKAAQTRKTNEVEAGYQRAVMAKKARQQGIDTRSLHQLAAEFLAHDREAKADVGVMLKDARKALDAHGGQHRMIGASQARSSAGMIEDPTQIPGLDEVAEWASKTYPHLFGSDPEGELFSYLQSGTPQPMSEQDAYEQAMDYLLSQKQGQEEIPVEEEPIPFARQHWTAEND